MKTNVLWCVLALGMAASLAMASDGTGMNWVFQNTGFYSNSGQTALAMRDGQTWPVIFASGSTTMGTGYNAYSLYPSKNSQTGTYWHQLGTNLLPTSGTGTLSAATSPTGQIAALMNVYGSSGTASAAVVGSSSTGFGTPMAGVKAIAFDSQGNLIKGTNSTIPSSFCPGELVDIATSPMGDVGAIDSYGGYYQKLAWTGQWTGGSSSGPLPGHVPYYADLALDSLGRAHIVGAYDIMGGYPQLIASDFDVVNGWTTKKCWPQANMVWQRSPPIASGASGPLGSSIPIPAAITN